MVWNVFTVRSHLSELSLETDPRLLKSPLNTVALNLNLGLLNKGATVIAVDRNISNLKKNGQLRPYELDITDWAALKGLYCDVLSKYGRIDVVVNNAGLFERISPLLLSVISNFPPLCLHLLPSSVVFFYCFFTVFVSVRTLCCR